MTLNIAQTDETVEFITISNPNSLNYTGSPRDKEIVEREIEQCMALALYIEDYTKINGLEKTMEEVNKGKKGELASFMPDSHYYLSFSENIWGESSRKIIAHATIPAAVGYVIPNLSMIKDNTGWSYNGEMQSLLELKKSNHGLIEGLIWTDPVWSPNSCRMTAFYTLFNFEGKEYNLYHAVWLDN